MHAYAYAWPQHARPAAHTQGSSSGDARGMWALSRACRPGCVCTLWRGYVRRSARAAAAPRLTSLNAGLVMGTALALRRSSLASLARPVRCHLAARMCKRARAVQLPVKVKGFDTEANGALVPFQPPNHRRHNDGSANESMPPIASRRVHLLPCQELKTLVHTCSAPATVEAQAAVLQTQSKLSKIKPV